MSANRQTHRPFRNHTHTHHSSPNYYYGNQQQHYNRHNNQRCPNYQFSRRHHSVHNNNTRTNNYSWFEGSGSYNTTADHEDFVRQYWHPYQTPDFQPHMPYYFSVDMALPSIVVNNHRRYYPVPYYELIEVTDPSESIETSGMLASQLTDQERNLAFERSLYDIVSHRLDGMDVRDEENEDEDHVLKYLKLRTHSAPAKEGVNPEVVADVESETCACAICQSEYEHEEDIGTLQCGHEYHVNCIKQWLLRKKDCPMCRASVLPSQEQIL